MDSKLAVAQKEYALTKLQNMGNYKMRAAVSLHREVELFLLSFFFLFLFSASVYSIITILSLHTLQRFFPKRRTSHDLDL
jgi:hypothetical protein